MGTLSVTSKSSITTTSGGTVRVEPAAKTLSNISEVYDKTISLAGGTDATLWQNSGLDLGYPADWESMQFVVETANAQCRLYVEDDQGSPVGLSFLCSDKFPFNLGQINTGTAVTATGNKVGKVTAENPLADTAVVVRIVLYGPMAS